MTIVFCPGRSFEPMASRLGLMGIAAWIGLAGAASALDLGGWRLKGGGALSFGAGPSASDGRRQAAAADLDLFGDATWTFQNGAQAGFAGRFRWQADDRARDANGGNAGQCPASLSLCPAIPVEGGRLAVRGPVSGLVSAGPLVDRLSRAAAEQAYAFAGNQWLELRAGRTAGAGAGDVGPSENAFGAFGPADAPLDLGGLNTIRTRNDISGFAPKILIKTKRILGLEAQASFAPRVIGQGVDWRAPRFRPGGPASPTLASAAEGRLSFETNALSLHPRLFVSYVAAADRSGLAAFGRYRALGAGAAFGLGPWEIGAQGLYSNNALAADGAAGRRQPYRSFEAYAATHIGPVHWTLTGARARDDLVGVHETGLGLAGRFSVLTHLSAGFFGLLQARDTPDPTQILIRQRGATLGFELRLHS